ncbi:ALDH [Ectocarpus sp. CCAP 1310/34]|nr:ALDH [Ectocarpus sp. CCAP 1310/34]
MWTPEMRSAAAEAAREALEGFDPIRTVAALAVCYAVLKLVHLVVTAPAIPTSVWVPLEPAESAAECLSGPSCKGMQLEDPERPGFIQCFDPCTLQRLGEVTAMDAADVEDVVRRARVAQEEWALTTFAERKRVLACLQRYILDNQDDIARVASRDSGKPVVDALLAEVMITCEKIRCISSNGEGWLARETRPTGPLVFYKKAYVEYMPLGVIGVIAPWNYPFHNVYNHIVSGIFAGNAVVSKVSEYTCWSSRYFTAIMAEVLKACGHNPDLCLTVTGFGDAGAALVASPNVDKIIFTGSPEVGRKVMEGCCKTLKPVVLELGGKDPFVVCDDVDMERVMPFVMKGSFFNAGQNCIGVERVYVYEKVYDRFVARVTELASKLRQGPVLGPESVDCGAMVMPAQLDIVQDLVNDAVSKGAKVTTGGSRNMEHPNGLFYLPTVLAGVTPDMKIAQEEVFGPVMSIIKVPGDSDEACIKMINSSKYGLASSVFSGSSTRAVRLGEAIRCGMTNVNDFGVNYLVQSLPFGGVKDSGYGRFAGPEGLRACCLLKSVTVDRFPKIMGTVVPAPLQYPVAKSGARFAASMTRMFYCDSLADKLWAVVQLVRASVGR